MREQLRIEWQRMIRGRLLYVALGVGLAIAVMQIIMEVYPRAVDPLRDYSGRIGEPDSLYLYCMCMFTSSLYNEIFITVFPILAMMPYALTYHMDVRSGYVKNVYTRTKKINYLAAKYIVMFVSAGLTVVIPNVVNIIISACMLPALNPIRNGNFASAGIFMHDIYFTKPMLFIGIYLVINFLYAGAYASTALAASYLVENVFMLSLVPFILWYGMGILSTVTRKMYNFNINPMTMVDIAGNIVYLASVFGVLAAVLIISAAIYFVNGVKADAL